jgi:hypothetical protein
MLTLGLVFAGMSAQAQELCELGWFYNAPPIEAGTIGVEVVVEDVNNDGYDDIIASGLFFQGEGDPVILFYGGPEGLPDTPDWTYVPTFSEAGFIILSGLSVGDINGDGWPDLLVNIDSDQAGGEIVGSVQAVFGSPQGFGDAPDWKVFGDMANTDFGVSSSTADVNGDGYDEVIIGAPSYLGSGRVFVYDGGPSGPSLAPDQTLLLGQAGANYGFDVAGVGDLNMDGFEDVVVGAPDATLVGGSPDGAAFAYLGGQVGLATTAAWNFDSNRDGSDFGWTVGPAGDVNGDGYPDVLVGDVSFSSSDAFQDTSEGRAYLFYGDNTGLEEAAAWTYEPNVFVANMGIAVGGGDLNGDGYDDVIVGADFFTTDPPEPGFVGNFASPGAVFAFLGSETGPQEPGFFFDSPTQNDDVQTGRAVGAGDFNCDGYADVVYGSLGYPGTANPDAVNTMDYGRLDVAFGSPAGPGVEGAPTFVYRFWNASTQSHFYTTNKLERDFVVETLPQFSLDGTVFRAYPCQFPGTSPVFRLFNPATESHFYTSSEQERDNAVSTLGFVFEEIVYYAFTEQVPGSTPLFRFFWPENGTHFYTATEVERDIVLDTLPQFDFEGIAYYVLPPPPPPFE